jgi:hypothetical protein
VFENSSVTINVKKSDEEGKKKNANNSNIVVVLLIGFLIGHVAWLWME